MGLLRLNGALGPKIMTAQDFDAIPGIVTNALGWQNHTTKGQYRSADSQVDKFHIKRFWEVRLNHRPNVVDPVSTLSDGVNGGGWPSNEK